MSRPDGFRDRALIRPLLHFVFGTWVGRYLTLSGVSLCINLLLTIGLHELAGLPEEASFFIALITVFFANFAGLRYYVYTDSSLSLRQQFSGYLKSSIGFRLAEYLAFLVAHTWLGCPYQATVATILIVSYAFKQLVHRTLVFKPDDPHSKESA